MLDHRTETFLLLCEYMNYRKTAEALGITQPAVTQQIHYLEKKYDCKLFEYQNHQLIKTDAAVTLEQYARSMRVKEQQLREKLKRENVRELKIGATKTIGDFFLPPLISRYLSREENALTFIVDNTEHLLTMLENNELDYAIVEGFFDKKKI